MYLLIALGAGHIAHGLGELHPSQGPKAEIVGVGVKALYAQVQAQLGKVAVAGPGDGLVQVGPAVLVGTVQLQVMVLEHAHKARAVAVIETIAVAHDSLLKPRDGHHGLEHRAGGVYAVEGPAEKGLVLVHEGGCAVVAVRKVQVLVITGVGGAGQHPEVLKVDGHRRPRPAVVGPVVALQAGVLVGLYVLLQGAVRHPLHIGVQGQPDGVALLGLLLDGGGHHVAVLVGEHGPKTPGAPQVLLESGLGPHGAYLLVGLVPGHVFFAVVYPAVLLHLLIGLVVYGPGIADDMGGDGAVGIVPLHAYPGLYALPAVLVLPENPHCLRGHAGGYDKGLVYGEVLGGHAVPYGGHRAGVLLGVALVVVAL